MNKSDMPNSFAWNDIEASLATMILVDGGFSLAHRGLVTLPAGQRVFVKIGTEKDSREWAQKEVAVYRYLRAHSYAHIPDLLSTNQDNTSFALEPLTSADGWDWTDTWTNDRLAATLKAMDDLAALQPESEDWMSMGQVAIDQSRNGWVVLRQSDELQQKLAAKLRQAGYAEIAETLNFHEEYQRSAQFVFRTDTLVHYDIRADNCAWNADKNQVKLVDWNWTQYGDTRIDNAAMLTHIQRSGFDISQSQAARLDADALQWLAGFWFKAAATPIWPGGAEHLRDVQLHAGATAFQLMKKS